jgi:hypothetical protein
MSSALVREALESSSRVGVLTPWPTKVPICAVPREGNDARENQDVWIRPVRTVPVKSHPFEPVVRPPRDATPHGVLPWWSASAGSAFSSRPALTRRARIEEARSGEPTPTGCSPVGAGADRSARNGHYDPKLAV